MVFKGSICLHSTRAWRNVLPYGMRIHSASSLAGITSIVFPFERHWTAIFNQELDCFQPLSNSQLIAGEGNDSLSRHRSLGSRPLSDLHRRRAQGTDDCQRCSDLNNSGQHPNGCPIELWASEARYRTGTTHGTQ